MPRPDISDKVIHFTGPHQSWEEAYRNLKSILTMQRIVANTHIIKGGHSCVCFTEAPLESVSQGFVNATNFSRYAPFGVMFDKKLIFAWGGRPVIYQSDSEYDSLPPSQQWRHVRYEPCNAEPIDFTWEREWRMQCSEVWVEPNEAAIVVPNTTWATRIVEEHDKEQDYVVESYSLALGTSLAEQYRDIFPWRLVPLEDKP